MTYIRELYPGKVLLCFKGNNAKILTMILLFQAWYLINWVIKDLFIMTNF